MFKSESESCLNRVPSACTTPKILNTHHQKQHIKYINKKQSLDYVDHSKSIQSYVEINLSKTQVDNKPFKINVDNNTNERSASAIPSQTTPKLSRLSSSFRNLTNIITNGTENLIRRLSNHNNSSTRQQQDASIYSIKDSKNLDKKDLQYYKNKIDAILSTRSTFKKKKNFCDTIDLNDFWRLAESIPSTLNKNTHKFDFNKLCIELASSSSHTNRNSTFLDNDNSSNTIRLSNTMNMYNYNLWCQLPLVRQSEWFTKMTRKEIEIQERWYEILQSELSYNKTLNILNEIIIYEFKKELSDYNINLIFTKYISDMIHISNNFIRKLKRRFEINFRVENLFDILYDMIVDSKFKIYVSFAGEQASQKENFYRLIKENKKLEQMAQTISKHPLLENKDISTFLIAPIQRLPKYKLLTDALLKLLTSNSDVYGQGLRVSKYLENLLLAANEKARKYNSFSEAIRLKMLLKFDSNDLIINNLVSAQRDLLYHGDLLGIQPVWIDLSLFNDAKQRKNDGYNLFNNIYHLILFSDILIITKKMSQDDKTFFYKVLEIFNRDSIRAEFSEWRLPGIDNFQSSSQSDLITTRTQTPSASPQVSNRNSRDSDISLTRLEHYYLLTLTIKNDDSSDIIREFKKPIDIKYCFSCSQLEGEEWIRHLSVKEEQQTDMLQIMMQTSMKCTCHNTKSQVDDEVDCKLILYTNRI